MSARDIGPSLPPHMKKDHGRDEDLGNCNEKRTRGFGNEKRRKQGDKYVGREDHSDRDRGRNRRDEYRDSDRSTRRYSGRDRDNQRETKERDRINRDRQSTGSSRKDRKELSSPCKRSKRSKTDRTYNTDTEESSDGGGYDTQKWDRVNDSDSTDSEQGTGKSKAEEHIGGSSYTSSSHDESKASDDVFGPALPPRLPLRGSPDGVDEKSSPGSSKPETGEESLPTSAGIGPALPAHLKSKSHPEQEEAQNPVCVGPALPPHLKSKSHPEQEEDQNPVCVGPALPPHLKRNVGAGEEVETDADNIGPALPPHLKGSSTSGRAHDKSGLIGPALPPGLGSFALASSASPPGPGEGPEQQDSSDDEVVGPLLPEEMMRSGKNYVIQAQLERNAAALKQKLEDKDLPDAGVPVREEWMLSLPPEGTVDLGLGPRTFRTRGAPEKGADRSSWTDTPADKARKEEEAKRRFELGISSTDDVKKAGLSKELSNRDKSMEVVVKKHKRSKESLLDSHHKKLKKEKKKKEEAGQKQARRPFDREADLKTNVFDDAQKKAIYKKAQLLDTRFSSGESKFL